MLIQIGFNESTANGAFLAFKCDITEEQITAEGVMAHDTINDTCMHSLAVMHDRVEVVGRIQVIRPHLRKVSLSSCAGRQKRPKCFSTTSKFLHKCSENGVKDGSLAGDSLFYGFTTCTVLSENCGKF